MTDIDQEMTARVAIDIQVGLHRLALECAYAAGLHIGSYNQGRLITSIHLYRDEACKIDASLDQALAYARLLDLIVERVSNADTYTCVHGTIEDKITGIRALGEIYCAAVTDEPETENG
jgi:hypothetical protein